MELLIRIAALCLLLLNILSFSLFGIDKQKAIHHSRRIPEKTLFLATALGGSLGSLVGMYVFRHKTRHVSFRLGVPALLALHLLAALLLSLLL